jgi:hypothetical protein
VIGSVSPSAGLNTGGTTVTITGTRFTGAFRLAFGGVAVPYTLDFDTQITVVSPKWSSIMAPAAGTTGPAASGGPVDVTVTTDVDTSAVTGADQFTYAST